MEPPRADAADGATPDPVLPSPPLPRDRWAADGFVIVRELIPRPYAEILNARLERILRGEYTTGVPPDKAPRLLPAERSAPKPGKPPPPPLGGPSKRTLQLINVWKSDPSFAALVTSPTLGHMVAELAGWPAGARVANDQVWAKPPGGAPLTFHRDGPYFDFVPADVVTVTSRRISRRGSGWHLGDHLGELLVQ